MFAFAILITFIFIGGMFVYSKNLMKTPPGGIYMLSDKEYNNAINSGGSIKMDAESLISNDKYQSDFIKEFNTNLFPIVILIFIILFMITFIFYMLHKSIQTKHTLKMVRGLSDSITESNLSDEPLLALTYKSLKEKFDNQLEDFKRLSSYLSHEQKNEIAILQARLENAGNTSELKKLDDIVDSIDDILTLSENLEQSKLSAVDVSLVCAQVYDSYNKTNPNILFEFDGNDDTEIMARSRWVYRAVANLLDNAIKYGEGKLIILAVMAKKGSVIIKISDQGIGISHDKQEIIFSNRYRINELNKNGYGIGLSLVSHVCDLCGGFVTVESEPQIGTTFYMSFPQIQ